MTKMRMKGVRGIALLLRVAVKTDAASPGMRTMGRQDGAHEGWGGEGEGGAAEEDVRKMREMRSKE